MSSLDGVPAALPGVRGRQCSPTGTSTLWLPLVVMLGVTLSGPVAAQTAPPEATTEVKTEVKPAEERWGIGAHPIIGFEPEASWTFGAAGTLFYNIDPGNPDQRLDEYTLNGTYSLRNQGTLSLDATKYLAGNRLHLEGDLVLTRNTSSTWGIGPNTPDSAEEEFMQAGVQPKLALLFEAFPSLSIGPELAFFYSNIFEVDPDGALASGTLAGKGKTFHTGIGLMVSYNSTNKKLYKIQGTKAELRGTLYSSYLSTSETFVTTELDLRHYIPLPWGLVLAMQLVLRADSGDLPFFYLETLGGKRLLRGYSSERYLGHDFVGTQVELRYPIFWRFGGTAFFGAADVEESLADLGSTVRFAGGMGLRLALNRSQTINLRFDITCNSDGEFEKYIKLGEAF